MRSRDCTLWLYSPVVNTQILGMSVCKNAGVLDPSQPWCPTFKRSTLPISGAKLTLTTSGRGRQRSDGTVDNTRRVRYACYGKTRKQTECDGQTGYTMHLLDDLIDEIVRGIFAKMRGVSKDDMIRLRYANELEIRKARLIVLNADYTKAVDNLQVLKGEVVNAIKGESSFSPEMLSGLIAEAEKECNRLAALCAQAEKDVTDSERLLKEVAASFDTLVSWAELYETASFEKKKMIANCLINRVDVLLHKESLPYI